jgi:N-acetylmuramic acid 6-phosphate etherase
MITTCAMILLGKVVGNKMVDMQLSNAKLIERGTQMIIDSTQVAREVAKKMLLEHGSVRAAVNAIESSNE